MNVSCRDQADFTLSAAYLSAPAEGRRLLILTHINTELAIQAAKVSAQAILPSNTRTYLCEAPGCTRHGYASGLCNAHYIRQRKQLPLDAPVRARKLDEKCTECGEKTGAKGGWGMCQKHYRQARKSLIKGAAIKAMGGSCSKCGGVFHQAVYDFHHEGVKDLGPSRLIANGSPEAIADELSKCVLLCANCHRMEHFHAND